MGVTVEVRCWLSVAGKWQSAVTLSWHGNRKASKSIKQYQLVLTAICNAVYTQFNTATTVTSHASFDPSLCSIHLTDIHTTLHKWRPLGGACCSLSLASSLVCTITAPLLVIYLEPHRQTKLILIDYNPERACLFPHPLETSSFKSHLTVGKRQNVETIHLLLARFLI